MAVDRMLGFDGSGRDTQTRAWRCEVDTDDPGVGSAAGAIKADAMDVRTNDSDDDDEESPEHGATSCTLLVKQSHRLLRG